MSGSLLSSAQRVQRISQVANRAPEERRSPTEVAKHEHLLEDCWLPPGEVFFFSDVM